MVSDIYKEGDRWRRRDRSVVLIYRVLDGVDRPIVTLEESNRKIARYNEDGKYMDVHMVHPYDLISFTNGDK